MTEYALEVGETTARVAFSILHLGVADTTKDNVPHAGRVSDVQPHSSTSPDTNSTRKPTFNRANEHAYPDSAALSGRRQHRLQRLREWTPGDPRRRYQLPSRTSAMPLTERR